VARSLGEHYDDLARAVPAFASLQGLFDVVMASQVLRTVAPQHPLLERAADRGFVPVSVPTTYQGVHVSHVLPGRLIVLEGGCQAGSPIATDALIEAPPELLAALPAAGRGVVEAPVYRSVGRAADVGAALLAGRAALAARRFEEAEDLATDALDLSHNDAAALSLRGVARVRGGRTYAGILDALEAMRRAPGDPTYEANLRALLEELGDADAFEGLTKPAAEVLATDYMARAATAALGRDFDAARAAASLARRVAPDAIDARVLLATVTWVAGDLPRARAIADEAAQSAPRSAEAQALVGWIATTQGDLPGASRALDRAIALEDTAEARGTRSAVRLVTGDLRGAGEDAYQALRLDVACWATDMAQRGLRLAACLGAADAARMLAASFRLPPSVQLDLYEAQHLMQTGDDAGAVAPYKQALGALLQDGVDEEVLKSSYAREMVMLMLARSITRAVPPVPADLEQVEPMLRAVEREHPDWVVPRWMRVTLAQARGDGAAALAALATCRGADPQADPMMRQFVPPSKAGFEGLLALLGATLPFTVPQGGPPPPEAFERLRAAYRGGPSEGVADALASVLETALLGDQDPASVAARAKLTQRAREVEAAPQATRAPEDVLIRASLLGGRVSAIVAGEGDDRDLASAMKALASLSPVPDVYESVTGTVAQTRKQALLSAIQGFVEQVERDPRSHRAQNLAEDDPDTARRLVASVVGPARDRAASLGEPVLAHFVDLVLIGVTADVDGRALEARMRRVKRVLEVATDPAKIARLEAAERDIEARIASLGTDLGRRAGARTEALRDALRTPCDVATLGALRTVMAQGATQRGERPEPPDPQDARRAAEVALGASLDALGVPRPEGLR
jgi:tetratricopeptide (TPR) repeat protein